MRKILALALLALTLAGGVVSFAVLIIIPARPKHPTLTAAAEVAKVKRLRAPAD
jgi:hypothetical protein